MPLETLLFSAFISMCKTNAKEKTSINEKHMVQYLFVAETMLN